MIFKIFYVRIVGVSVFAEITAKNGERQETGVFGIEIDRIFILAQAVGLFATLFGIVSFQSRRRKNIIVLQIFSNGFWIIHYLLLGSMAAVAANSLGAIRNIIYSMSEKYKFARSKAVPAVSVVLFIVLGILTYTGPFDILPTAAMVVASVAFFVKNEKVIRYMSLVISASWFIFGISVGSIASFISDGFILVSIIIAIWRYREIKIYESEDTVA